MASIKVKGYAEPIQIPNDKARAIFDVWGNDSIPNSQKITVNNLGIVKGDITFIATDQEERERMKDYKNPEVDYQIRRKKFLELSVNEKVEKSYSRFKLICRCFGVSEIPADILESHRRLAEQFFGENRYRTSIPLRLYEPIITSHKEVFSMRAKGGGGGLMLLGDMLQSHVWDILALADAVDEEEARVDTLLGSGDKQS